MPPRARTAAAESPKVIEGDIVENETKEWGAAELNGRRIVFNEPNPAQLIVLRRLNRQLGMARNGGEKFLLIAKILDAVSALMADDEDREFADLEVLEGRADLDTVTPLVIAAIGGTDTLEKWQEEKDTPAPRRVRRARR